MTSATCGCETEKLSRTAGRRSQGCLTLDATGMVSCRRSRYALPYRRAQVNAARRCGPKKNATPPRSTHSDPAVRNHRQRAQHLCDGLSLRGSGLHDRIRRSCASHRSRHVHEEFEDHPIIDKGFYVLMGNNHYIMKQIAANEPQRVKAYIAWLLNASKGSPASW